MAELPALEAISEWDGSWYDVDLERSVVICHGDKYGVKIVYQGSDEDEYDVVYAEQFAKGIRYSSQPVQDDECRRLQPGVRVAVLAKWPDRDEQKYYDAEVATADFKQHGSEEGQCNCLFGVKYILEQEPKAKLEGEFVAPVDTRYRIDDICFPGKPALDHPTVQRWLKEIQELTATAPPPRPMPQPTEGSSAAGGAEQAQQELGSGQKAADKLKQQQHPQKGLFTISSVSGSAAGTEAARRHILQQAAFAKEAEAAAAGSKPAQQGPSRTASPAAVAQPVVPATSAQAPTAAAATASITPAAPTAAPVLPLVSAAVAQQPVVSTGIVFANPQSVVLATHALQQAAALQAARALSQVNNAGTPPAAAVVQQTPAAQTPPAGGVKRPAEAAPAGSGSSNAPAKRPRTIIPPLTQQPLQQQQKAALATGANHSVSAAGGKSIQAPAAAASAAGSPAQKPAAGATVTSTPTAQALPLSAGLSGASAAAPSPGAKPPQVPVVQQHKPAAVTMPFLFAHPSAAAALQMNYIRAAAAAAGAASKAGQQPAQGNGVLAVSTPLQQQPQPVFMQLQQQAAIQSVMVRLAQQQKQQQHPPQQQQQQQHGKQQQSAAAQKPRQQQQSQQRMQAQAVSAPATGTAAASANASPAKDLGAVVPAAGSPAPSGATAQQQHQQDIANVSASVDGDLSIPADATEAQKRYYMEIRNGKPTAWLPGPDHGLPKGWYVLERTRVTGASQGTKDRYYLGPDGKMLRSRNEAVAKASEMAKLQLLVDAAEQVLAGRVRERSPVSLEGPALARHALSIQQRVIGSLKEHNTLLQLAALPLRLSDITNMAALHNSGQLDLLPAAATGLFHTAKVHTEAHIADGRLSEEQGKQLLSCLALLLEVSDQEEEARKVLAAAVGAPVPGGPLPSQVTAAKAAAAAAAAGPHSALPAGNKQDQMQQIMNCIVPRVGGWANCPAEQLNGYLEQLIRLGAQLAERRHKAIQAAAALDKAMAMFGATSGPATAVASAEVVSKSTGAPVSAKPAVAETAAVGTETGGAAMDIDSSGKPLAGNTAVAEMDVDRPTNSSNPPATVQRDDAKEEVAVVRAAEQPAQLSEAEVNKIVKALVAAAIKTVVGAAEKHQSDQGPSAAAEPAADSATGQSCKQLAALQSTLVSQLDSALLVLRAEIASMAPYRRNLTRSNLSCLAQILQLLSLPKLQDWPDCVGPQPSKTTASGAKQRKTAQPQQVASAAAGQAGAPPGQLPLMMLPSGMQRPAAGVSMKQPQQHVGAAAQQRQQQQQHAIAQQQQPLAVPVNSHAAGATSVQHQQQQQHQKQQVHHGQVSTQTQPGAPVATGLKDRNVVTSVRQQQQQQQQQQQPATVTQPASSSKPVVQKDGRIDPIAYGQFLATQMLQQLQSQGIPSPPMPADQVDMWKKIVAQHAKALREVQQVQATRAAAATAAGALRGSAVKTLSPHQQQQHAPATMMQRQRPPMQQQVLQQFPPGAVPANLAVSMPIASAGGAGTQMLQAPHLAVSMQHAAQPVVVGSQPMPGTAVHAPGMALAQPSAAGMPAGASRPIVSGAPVAVHGDPQPGGGSAQIINLVEEH